MGKIDVHAHYLPPAYREMLARRGLTILDGGFPVPDWSVEAHLSAMEELDVDFSVMSVSSPHVYMGDDAEAAEVASACNDFGSECATERPKKLAFFGCLPTPDVDAAVAEAQRCAELTGCKGFCLPTNSRGTYLGDARLDPLMAKLDELGAIVLIHPTEPSAVPSGVCETVPFPMMEFFFDTCRAVVNLVVKSLPERYPNIKWIVPHAGAYLPIICDRIAPMSKMVAGGRDIDVEASLKRFYYDLAGTVVPKQLGCILDLAEKERLLYASDYPFTPLALDVRLAKLLDAALPEDLRAPVAYGNACALLGLPEAGKR
ncbi:amidohydrolase family protein [Paratractidigestivibacter sp.]|uniref:amidohydrolase family protein n=1 Tax=Paratractidigestivibacter sp. TaxID=2847316 RepID=UPI002AC8F8C3|nr:amidohydrolase family protein [Paratractidigestivibacter sp.]